MSANDWTFFGVAWLYIGAACWWSLWLSQSKFWRIRITRRDWLHLLILTLGGLLSLVFFFGAIISRIRNAPRK